MFTRQNCLTTHILESVPFVKDMTALLQKVLSLDTWHIFLIGSLFSRVRYTEISSKPNTLSEVLQLHGAWIIVFLWAGVIPAFIISRAQQAPRFLFCLPLLGNDSKMLFSAGKYSYSSKCYHLSWCKTARVRILALSLISGVAFLWNFA